MRHFVPVLLPFLLLAASAAPQQAARPTIRKVNLRPTATVSGQEMFSAYCASCHGIGGKGDGPAAPALKSTVPDLTRIAERNGGTFPDAKVLQSIKGDPDIAAHGSRDMPVWGVLLHQQPNREAFETMALLNLVRYVQSLQK